MLKIIDIDATQHPDLIFDQLKTTLLCKGFSIYNPVIYAKKLPPFEGQIGGNEIEIWKHYENINVTSGAPCRIQSMFAKRCPVSYYQGAHNETDMSIASSYKNRVYFFHSSECQEQFSANPEKFVCQEIKQAKLKIFVLGGAGTGKTIQSHLVAKKYDLIYLSFEEALHSGASTISKEILTVLHFNVVFKEW
jgi:YHS domain-containing protein